MMSTMTGKRRICWPEPDATCLEGGCIYCNDHDFVSLDAIRAYAQNAGVLQNRGSGEQDAMEAFLWGLRNGFPKADTGRKRRR